MSAVRSSRSSLWARVAEWRDHLLVLESASSVFHQVDPRPKSAHAGMWPTLGCPELQFSAPGTAVPRASFEPLFEDRDTFFEIVQPPGRILDPFPCGPLVEEAQDAF